MIKVSDINDFFEELFGPHLIFSDLKKEHSSNKKIIENIIVGLEELSQRDVKMGEEWGIDITSYSEPFFVSIENLIQLHFGPHISELIMFYVYSRIDFDGNLIPFEDIENGEEIYMETFEDLWLQINKLL